MPPAARVGDTHLCPIHGPNAIVSGSPDTIFNGRLAARVGDMTACGAPIVTGSLGVFINDRPAVRMGDKTAHGGVIANGDLTIEIGDYGMSYSTDGDPAPPLGQSAYAGPQNQPWDRIDNKDFHTIPPPGFDVEKLDAEQRKVYDFLKDQGWLREQINEVMLSGTEYRIVEMKAGQILFGFTSRTHPKKSDSPYWSDNAEGQRLKAKYYRNGVWDKQGVKDELALPCKNRADAISITTLKQDCKVLAAKINLAAENTFYYRRYPDEVIEVPNIMPGGGAQRTPPQSVLGEIETRAI
jgi:uncharacterized Zn-binding protein involved in type VI secretion